MLLAALSSFSLIACSPDSTEVESETADEDLEFRGAHANGLVLHWTFQDRTGTQIHDISGHGHHGTVHGASFVSSAWGEAISLDGVDDYVSFVGPRDPADFAGGVTDGAFTISARVKVADVDRYNFLCTGCAPLAAVSIGTANVGPRVNAAVYDQSTTLKTWPASTSGVIADNTWANVTMVVEAGIGTKYYIDCAFDVDVPNANVGLHNYNYSSVGQGGGSTSWYDGEIDDLRVWDRALSSSEIADLCDEPVETACDGAPEAATLGITLPTPPSAHTTPAGTTVSDTAGLVAALANGDTTIVLADGVYTTTGLPAGQDYIKLAGQQLWASTSGGVTLPYGVQAGGNGTAYQDSELHGIVFDIADNTYAARNPSGGGEPSAIMNWGGATGLVIEDCVIKGNGVLEFGVFAAQPDGLEIRRSEVAGARFYGIYADNNDKLVTLTTPIEIHHVRVHDIVDPLDAPDKWPTAINVGHEANVSHVHIRDVRYSGILTGNNSDGAVLSYLDIDRIAVGESTGGVGVYVEWETFNLTVKNFCMGPNTRIGVNSEWDEIGDPNVCGTHGTNTVVRDGLSESSVIGVHFDQGTRNGDVHDVVFRNYTTAGIVFYNNLSAGAVTNYPTQPVYDDGSTQSNNTFEVAQDPSCDGLCDFTRSHWNSVYWGNPLVCEDCTPVP